jgi:hypothetical protein
LDPRRLYNYGYLWTPEYSASSVAASWRFNRTTDDITPTGSIFMDSVGEFHISGATGTGSPLEFRTTAPDGTSNLFTPTIATFSLTASAQDADYNNTVSAVGSTIYLNGQEYVNEFFSFGTLSGGVTPIPGIYRYGFDNVIDSQRDDLTSSNSIIRTRFSAPGGPEINTRGYLDIGSQEFSVYNAMPFRNLSVLGSGSGEAGTIRVDSPASRREGLRTLYTRHCGRYGIDSQWGAIQEDSYVVVDASYHKINRNTRVVVETGSLIITESVDNFHVSRPIPSQDYGYAWVTASLGEEMSVRSEKRQIVFGYWPKDGIASASADVEWRDNGFDSAVNFPTASNGDATSGEGLVGVYS